VPADDTRPDHSVLDDFRQLHGADNRSRSKLISMKVPENLLKSFRTRAELAGVPYQTQIKKLMKKWVVEAEADEK